MNETQLLMEVDFKTVFTGLIIIGVALKFIYELASYFADKLGIEFKWQRRKKEDREIMLATSEKVNDLVEIVKGLSAGQEELRANQEVLHQKIVDVEEENIKYRQSDTRNEIIKLYRYFCDETSNPMKAWTKIEYDSFMQLYEVYSLNRGNSYIHDEIYPEMQKLGLIELTDTERLAKLYASRSRRSE